MSDVCIMFVFQTNSIVSLSKIKNIKNVGLSIAPSTSVGGDTTLGSPLFLLNQQP